MGKFNKRVSNKRGRHTHSHTGTDVGTDIGTDTDSDTKTDTGTDRLLQKGTDSDSCNRQRKEDREHVENSNLEMTPSGSAFISFLNATLMKYW